MLLASDYKIWKGLGLMPDVINFAVYRIALPKKI